MSVCESEYESEYESASVSMRVSVDARFSLFGPVMDWQPVHDFRLVLLLSD